MGRGKQRRKNKQKQKRMKKIAQGKHVPFSLANSSRKLKGRHNKHEYKTNIHNLIFVDATFKNVKYTASNITFCNFRKTKITGVDYINTNLKKSKFKNAHFENVIFYSANLKDTDFSNATFKNVYFINTNVFVARNLDINQSGIHLLKGIPTLKIDNDLFAIIEQLMQIPKIRKHYVLTTKNSKTKEINEWIIYLLLQSFSQKELTKAFRTMYLNKNKNANKTMLTYYSYLYFLTKYFKKDDII
ncbi:pentapeptide repeat-containing protein [Bacillus velezensis]|uniref:pentapeptide repeat-containing protein n=1 Tax=Bacillus TaxID=1386 RepID=UPI0007613D5A|nr:MULTISPECIES: pentapeptide repeat-containing protein [Bacillus]AMQ71651.1 hypothetical protein BAMY6639_14685 [Bacillus amyloliquefaciens UMAF6639]MBI0443857.1 pentapeptide repeat-containing protein [Bacillus velezensis]MCC8310615.1 pentapeptide repeat-containing protein [Bacillus velezensis]MCD5429412.1 pentapeptide repeat-containing protein [Bacillus amyloliquefaciens]MCO7133947.1 pentapeptide repeat-containing protein [Bacillus velezensis]